MTVTPSRAALSVTAALVLAAGAATASIAHAASVGCSVSYAVQSQWPGGFQGSVAVKNLGDPLAAWTLTWSFTGGQQISQSWSAVVTQSGTQATAASESWNGALSTGTSTAFGFIATWNGASNPAPTSFALNGITCTGAATPATTSAPPTTTPSATATTPTPTSASPAVLSQAHTAGRVNDLGTSVQYTWPGISFEGRFHGTGVGIVLNDSSNDYDVQIDGTTVTTLVTPGQTTSWVNNLPNADHTVRLVKRTESPWAAGGFGGFVPAAGGSILSKPTARSRQIEFIGDSYTAGYGNMSTTRDCSSNGGVDRNSDADLSFGALTARGLDADYQITAWSGMGMVRNYGGNNPGLSFRSYYDQTLQAAWNSTAWQNPGTWKPQLVVVGLGINDFSTSLTANEKWATSDALVADYKTAYQGFLDKLRAKYGPSTIIVVSATYLSNTTLFADTAQQIVKDRNAQGDNKVTYWYYDSPNLDHLGCDWHPSLHDDQIISGLLNTYLTTLPLTW